MKTYTTVDEYIASYPEHIQELLKHMREIIRETAPDATETISYGIPTFVYHGNLVHFAGYDSHIGFYPGSGPIADFQDQLKPYKTAKGTVQFPLDKPLPIDLIQAMTQSAIDRNLSKSKK